MQQRRTPSGQGPGARGGRDPRETGRRTTGRPVAGRVTGGRAATRETGLRAEPSRTTGTRGSAGQRKPAAAAPGNRPPAARRATSAGAVTRTRPPRQGRLSGRAAVMCMLLIGLLLAYAYPVRMYLSQQNEIDQLERHQAAQRQHIDDLAGELQKWNDDRYVASQVRGRLLWMLPGEKPLIVVGRPTPPGTPGSAATGGGGAAEGPWYDQLWTSVRSADQGGTP